MARWARQHDLPYYDEHVRFPDARIEYEDRDGRSRHEDMEVMTGHYRGAHAGAAARSGFTRYRSIGVVVGGRGADRWTIELANTQRTEAVASFGSVPRRTGVRSRYSWPTAQLRC